MTRYYNTQRGPIAVPLQSGKTVSVPPKSWVEIDPSDEGSERVVAFSKNGFLVRQKVPSVVLEPETETPKATSLVVAPKPEPKEVEVEEIEEAPESHEDASEGLSYRK